MVLHGTYRNRTVVLDEQPSLPEGARVSVQLEEIHTAAKPEACEAARSNRSISQRLLDLAGSCPGLPADMSTEHDHYLYGSPKKHQTKSHP